MSTRVTQKQLQAVVDLINKATGSPLASYVKTGDRYVAQIGNYHLDKNIGGWALERMFNEGGGVQSIISRYPAGQMLDMLHAFLRGIETKAVKP